VPRPFEIGGQSLSKFLVESPEAAGNDDLVFYLITWGVVVVCAGSAWSATRRFFKDPLRTIFVVLLGIQALLAVLYMLSFDSHVSTWWRWFFDIHTEFNLEAMFQLPNLLLASPRWPQKLFWIIITLGFIFLSLDEYFSIHELTIGLGSFREVYLVEVCGLSW
jgi:hypothetical protein